MAVGSANLRTRFPRSKLGVPYNPFSSNPNPDEESVRTSKVEESSEYPLCYVTHGFMRFPVVDPDVQTKLMQVIKSLGLHLTTDLTITLTSDHSPTNCPRYVYFLAAILGSTVEATISSLQRQNLLEVLKTRLIESTSREKSDIKQEFLDRYMVSDDSCFDFLNPLYDIVDGDEGLFVLGLLLTTVLSMRSSIPFVSGKVTPSGITKKPFRLNKENDPESLKRIKESNPLDTNPGFENYATSKILQSNSEILSPFQTTPHEPSHSPNDLPKELQMPTLESTGNVMNGVSEKIPESTEESDQNPETVFYFNIFSRLTIKQGQIYVKKSAGPYEELICPEGEYHHIFLSDRFFQAKRDLESDIFKIKNKESAIKSGKSIHSDAASLSGLTPEEVSLCSRLKFDHTDAMFPSCYVDIFRYYHLNLDWSRRQILGLVTKYNWPDNESFESVLFYFLSPAQVKWLSACVAHQNQKERKLESLSTELNQKVAKLKSTSQPPSKEEINSIFRKCAIGYFRQYDAANVSNIAFLHESAEASAPYEQTVPMGPLTMVRLGDPSDFTTIVEFFDSEYSPNEIAEITAQLKSSITNIKKKMKTHCSKVWGELNIDPFVVNYAMRALTQGKLLNLFKSFQSNLMATNRSILKRKTAARQKVSKTVSSKVAVIEDNKKNIKHTNEGKQGPEKQEALDTEETITANESATLSSPEHDYDGNSFDIGDGESSDDGYGTFNDKDYSRYVYDELDADEDFVELVDSLAGVFPTHPRTLLKIRIKTTDNIDQLIEELCLEQETHELMATLVEEEKEITNQKTFSPKVYQLMDIFPTYDGEVLEKILEANSDDLELATNSLLTGNHEERFETTTEVINDLSSADSEMVQSTNMTKLVEITGIPANDVSGYLSSNHGRFVESLIDIIYTYKPKEPEIKIDIQIPRGGRVQRGRKQAPQQRWGPKYKYDNTSSEAQELSTLYKSNPQLQELNPKFCERALEFYKGDVIKTIDLCRIVIEKDGASSTYGPEVRKKGKKIVLSLADTKDTARELSRRRADIKAQADANAKASSRTKSTSPTAPMLLSQRFAKYQTKLTTSNADDFQLQSERYQEYKRTGVLDLHHLRLTTALQASRRALKEWWDEEIRLREQEGTLHRFGSDARFVDSIKLITGRGIHSTGGVSIIRRQVQDLLRRNNFIYTESVGHFVVCGRRK